MIPISRVEMYLAKICGEDVELPIPQTRKEVFLAIIAGESYEKPVPSSRVELYLAKILGDDVPLPIPQSREEIFLAAIAGVEYPLPYPESRIEYWLHKWATYEEWSTISGNPVSFTAKAAPLRQLEVAFSPVQNLNGYDSPWPAGGGKNKLPNTRKEGTYISEVVSVYENGVMTIVGTPSSSGGRYALRTGYASLPAGTYYAKAFDEQGANKPALTVQRGATYISGSVFTLDEAADDVNIGFNVTSGVEYNYTAKIGIFTENVTAWTPYSNECPISGWDSLEVFLTNGNLWSPTDSEAGYINASGAISGQGSTSLEYSSDYVLVPDSVTYVTFGYGAYESDESKWGMIGLYDEQKNFIARQGSVGANGLGTYNIRAYQNVKYIRGTTRTYGHGTDKCFLAFGRDVPFTPYNPSSRSISISLGETVYSGWVDVISGVGEVTMASVDLGTLDWTYSSGEYSRMVGDVAGIKPTGGGSILGNILCSALANDTVSHIYAHVKDYTIGVHNTIPQVWVYDSRYTDPVVFKTAMNGVQLVYELATPIPIQLTPQEVQSLAGDNTMWSDANDDLTVEYRSN